MHLLNSTACNSMRMNLSVTTPYGADFDGDEMNGHPLQSLPVRAEGDLMAVPRQLMHPQKNGGVRAIARTHQLVGRAGHGVGARGCVGLVPGIRARLLLDARRGHAVRNG